MRRIVCRLAVVFQPVTKQGPAGLEVRIIESVVSARIDNELYWRPVIAPASNSFGAVCRWRPSVECANEDKRGDPRTRPGNLTGRIECSRCPELQVAGKDEPFGCVGLRHGESNPGASRESYHCYTPWIDEGLASQEYQTSTHPADAWRRRQTHLTCRRDLSRVWHSCRREGRHTLGRQGHRRAFASLCHASRHSRAIR
jgi:hypothetical protein